MGAKTSSSTLCLNKLNSKEKFLLNPFFVPFRLPLFLAFHFDKVYDMFIYANFRRRALLVLNRIESSEFTKQIVVFSLIVAFLLFNIKSTKGDFIVYFGFCLGSTGLSTSKHEAVGLFLLFPHFH